MLREPVPPSRNAGCRRFAALATLGALAVGGTAQAAGSKEAQALKALKQALDEDYLQTRFDEAERKLRAALQSCGQACSISLRARLHAALGAVLAGGKKQLEDARDELVEALVLDPKIQPNPGLLSAEVSFAYEEARKKLRLAPAPTPPEKVATGEKPDDGRGDGLAKANASDPPEAPPSEPARQNRVTLSFSPDLAFVSGSNVCTGHSQSFDHYVCLRPDRSRYVGTPTLDNADDIHTGVALATMRLMLGYDRLVHPNVTLGLRAGFAFNGASGGGASFLPVHAEGRLGLWPGHEPFAGTGAKPYFVVSGGLAQVDAKVSVQVLESGAACGAASPSNTASPCTKPSSDGTVEQRQQTLAAYKQSGLGFASLAFGVRFAPSVRVVLHLAARASVTFPVLAAVISPEGGVSVGF